MVAITAVVATVLFSCSGKLKQAEALDLSETPRQTVDDMFAVQSENGIVKMRIEAPLMQRFETDTASVETFPDGFYVYAYTEEGLLETTIISDRAKHFTFDKDKRELWEVTGNVSIQNVVNQQTMETDTLYWDQSSSLIYTDSYVRMYSPDGFMQGYGMQSDDHARDAFINRPFNSYGVVVQDTTVFYVDSINFIGPFPKK